MILPLLVLQHSFLVLCVEWVSVTVSVQYACATWRSIVGTGCCQGMGASFRMDRLLEERHEILGALVRGIQVCLVCVYCCHAWDTCRRVQRVAVSFCVGHLLISLSQRSGGDQNALKASCIEEDVHNIVGKDLAVLRAALREADVACSRETGLHGAKPLFAALLELVSAGGTVGSTAEASFTSQRLSCVSHEICAPEYLTLITCAFQSPCSLMFSDMREITSLRNEQL